MTAPRLIVGLGNPGRDYEETRHNAGFWFCARLAQTWGVLLAHESRFHGIVGRSPGNVWMLLPQTFMNRSGQAVGAFARFHRIAPAEILVVHDELDIPPGQLRLKFGGGKPHHIVTELDVQCLPGSLPEFIEVDMGNLEIGHSIHANDLTLPAGVELVAHLQTENPSVASISAPKVGAATEEAPAAPAAPAA